MLVRLLLVATLLLAACDGDGETDAGPGTDAGGEIDAGMPDAGPGGPAYCGPCRRDSDCGEGALCMLLPGGERGCSPLCATDADCEGLAPGATCIEEDVGLPLVCRPTGET